MLLPKKDGPSYPKKLTPQQHGLRSSSRESTLPRLRVMAIRHAEKPTPDGAVQGVTLNGVSNPDELSVRGWQRAGALVSFFASSFGAPRRGIERPEFLVAPGTTPTETSVRSAHTLQPLAEYLGLAVSTHFLKGQEAELATAIDEFVGGVVLVAWEHKALCDLANAMMGGDERTPQRWPDDRFDVVWVFERDDASGAWQFSQVPQLLLAGDSDEPI